MIFRALEGWIVCGLVRSVAGLNIASIKISRSIRLIWLIRWLYEYTVKTCSTFFSLGTSRIQLIYEKLWRWCTCPTHYYCWCFTFNYPSGWGHVSFDSKRRCQEKSTIWSLGYHSNSSNRVVDPFGMVRRCFLFYIEDMLFPSSPSTRNKIDDSSLSQVKGLLDLGTICGTYGQEL